MAILRVDGTVAEWQAGIPPYKLAKLDGPKGNAAAAALLRAGFVRVHAHGL